MTSELKPIFLFSLPRSGSTLLQRVLGAHPEVATLSEPHLLLPFLYSKRRSGIYAEYGQELVVKGIDGFCRELPNGEEDYWEEVRRLVMRLYAKAVTGEPRYFLDKTPRYTLVLDDIMRIFKDARVIILVRNPMAILSSMLGTFKSGRWCAYAFNADLFTGLPNLISACREAPERVHLVRYEDLVADCEAECRRLCSYLDIPWHTAQATGFAAVQIKGLGDQAGIKNYRSISREPLDKWKTTLSNPLRKAWCRRYLRWIGAQGWRAIGYDLEELLAEVDAIPSSAHMIASDLVRIPYGIAYRALEPKLMLRKLSLLPHWQKLNAHY